MSKSIYEEALKESKDFGSFVGLKLDKVNNALEQAQKQEKLLDFYKELATVRGDMLYCYEAIDFIAYNAMEKKETQLEKQIKELENDKS